VIISENEICENIFLATIILVLLMECFQAVIISHISCFEVCKNKLGGVVFASLCRE